MGGSIRPKWTVELDKAAVAETVKDALNLASSCTIRLLVAKGSFNKIYVAHSAELPEQGVVARISLPMDPTWKTESEVANLKWVRENTSLPVPRVLAHRSDRSSAIGFEYIIMEKMPGVSLANRWARLDSSAKRNLVCQVASFCSDTFRLQMRGMGSLFLGDTSVNKAVETSFEAPGIHLGRMVSPDFINAGPRRSIPPGPFSSSREWMSARLDLTEADCQRRLGLLRQQGEDGNSRNGTDASDEDEEDEEGEEGEEDEEDDLENALTIIAKLKAHLDDFFPQGGPVPEPSMIFHHDLSRRNVLVDGNTGALTAVLD